MVNFNAKVNFIISTEQCCKYQFPVGISSLQQLRVHIHLPTCRHSNRNAHASSVEFVTSFEEECIGVYFIVLFFIYIQTYIETTFQHSDLPQCCRLLLKFLNVQGQRMEPLFTPSSPTKFIFPFPLFCHFHIRESNIFNNVTMQFSSLGEAEVLSA